MNNRELYDFDDEEQNQLAFELIEEGEDPENWKCRTCGAIYDGGQRCTYCGDHNPLDNAELEFEEEA